MSTSSRYCKGGVVIVRALPAQATQSAFASRPGCSRRLEGSVGRAISHHHELAQMRAVDFGNCMNRG
jgi:hypothetical protein